VLGQQDDVVARFEHDRAYAATLSVSGQVEAGRLSRRRISD
jgi:hypothetical protein